MSVRYLCSVLFWCAELWLYLFVSVCWCYSLILVRVLNRYSWFWVSYLRPVGFTQKSCIFCLLKKIISAFRNAVILIKFSTNQILFQFTKQINVSCTLKTPKNTKKLNTKLYLKISVLLCFKFLAIKNIHRCWATASRGWYLTVVYKWLQITTRGTHWWKDDSDKGQIAVSYI